MEDMIIIDQVVEVEEVVENTDNVRHSDDMQDIITAVPSWILRWGISLFFFLIVLIICLSAFIRYPDIVNTTLKIESPNTPKPVIAKTSGKLIKLLVKESEKVLSGQTLAYMESTADPDAVIKLSKQIDLVRDEINIKQKISNTFIQQKDLLELGELQTSYQTFFQAYLNYQSAVNGGFYLRKKEFLQKDLINLSKQREQLSKQKDIQQKDYALASQEFEMHKNLVEQQVETKAEFRGAQSRLLTKKSPMVQTEAAIIAANSNYDSKQREILELDNLIVQEKLKFLQSLNSLISQVEDWKNKYVLSASQNGKVNFVGLIQENQQLKTGQEVFYINPGNEQFFGQMSIPQNNMGKVREGQEVLIKLKSYPYEQYGFIRGKITHIADVPLRDSVFMSKVDFQIKKGTDMKRPVNLKQGMLADGEIITQDATILQRIIWNFVKITSQQ